MLIWLQIHIQKLYMKDKINQKHFKAIFNKYQKYMPVKVLRKEAWKEDMIRKYKNLNEDHLILQEHLHNRINVLLDFQKVNKEDHKHNNYH